MAQEVANLSEEVVISVEIDHVRLITLNRPRQLNVISPRMVYLLAEYLEKWEKDEKVELVLIKASSSTNCQTVLNSLAQRIVFRFTFMLVVACYVKGTGCAFSAGGDLKVFYDGRKSSCTCPWNFNWRRGVFDGANEVLSCHRKNEANIGFHTDSGFSYMLSRLPGHLGEFIALTGARLNGTELVAAGLATHLIPSEKMPKLEKSLISLNSGDENAVRTVIEGFTVEVQLDEDSLLNKQLLINKCFSKDTVAEIIESLEAEANKEGNSCMNAVLKALKRSSPREDDTKIDSGWKEANTVRMFEEGI